MKQPFHLYLSPMRCILSKTLLEVAEEVHPLLPPELNGLSVASLASELSVMERAEILNPLREGRALVVYTYLMDRVRSLTAASPSKPTQPEVNPLTVQEKLLAAYDAFLRESYDKGDIPVANSLNNALVGLSVLGLQPYNDNPLFASYPKGTIFLSLFTHLAYNPGLKELSKRFGYTQEDLLTLLQDSGRMISAPYPFGSGCVGRKTSWCIMTMPQGFTFPDVNTKLAPKISSSDQRVKANVQAALEARARLAQLPAMQRGIQIQDLLDSLKQA